jgi:hypothetical protein
MAKVSNGNPLSVETWKLKVVSLDLKPEVQISHPDVTCTLQMNARVLDTILLNTPCSFSQNRNEALKTRTGQFELEIISFGLFFRSEAMHLSKKNKNRHISVP